MKQNRKLTERTAHTSCGLGYQKCVHDQGVNDRSIAIVLAGNFQPDASKGFKGEQVTREQIKALKSLIARLDAIYAFEKIIPHRDASPTACPGEHVITALKGIWRGDTVQPVVAKEPAIKTETWNITRYYSPVPRQSRYFRKGADAYKRDVEMNCGLFSQTYLAKMREQAKSDPLTVVTADGRVNDYWGDCETTANGHKLQEHEAFTIAACPPNMPFGTRLDIAGIGIVTCQDRGGAIKGKRLDIWAGYGEAALDAMKTKPAGNLAVRFLTPVP